MNKTNQAVQSSIDSKSFILMERIREELYGDIDIVKYVTVDSTGVLQVWTHRPWYNGYRGAWNAIHRDQRSPRFCVLNICYMNEPQNPQDQMWCVRGAKQEMSLKDALCQALEFSVSSAEFYSTLWRRIK